MLLAAFLAVGGAVAADEAKADIGVWTNVPAGIENKSITGVRFGLPCSISNGTVKGAELSIFFSGTRNAEAFKFAWIGATWAETLKGGALACVNIAEERLAGIQVGAVNLSGKGGFQLGFFNNCDDDAKFQLGLININKKRLAAIHGLREFRFRHLQMTCPQLSRRKIV